MEYEKHADTRNATFELNGSEYLEYIENYVSPQKARKHPINVRQRKRLARILKRGCIRDYSPDVCYMDMHDTASFILDCGFTKKELPFIKEYFRGLYEFIHTKDFKEHKLYYYGQREKGDWNNDSDFVYHNAFRAPTWWLGVEDKHL